MQTNRRNLLMGMGALAVGGGAVMGSGAFTEGSATVTREVEVTVIAQGDLGKDYVDILALGSDYDSLDFKPAGGGSLDDGSGKFPTSSGTPYDFSAGGANYTNQSTDASLLANDLRLVFGDSVELPPNSAVDYTNLFAVANESGGSNSKSYDVEITSTTGTTPSVTSSQGPVTVPDGESRFLDATVHTGDTDSNAQTEVDTDGLIFEITPN